MSDYKLSIPVNKADHIQGKMDAPVVLVEYGDYECPYCGEAFPIVKQIQKHFGDKLGFVFRNFPLSQMHPYAMHAAEAAELAAQNGKFWEMHDSLYEDQNQLTDPALVARAKLLGMDTTKFAAELEANTMEPKVQADFMSGVESGVNGTPSFFINGNKYDGNWDYENLKMAIDAAML